MAIFLCVILLVGTIFGNTTEVYLAKDNLSMYSGSYALMDGDTGRVLVGKEEESAMANASTTKILTCIITLENCDLEELVTVSANAAAQPKVHLGMKEGEQFLLKDLLYGLMLESYNDCAVAIAEHIAGSTEAFAKMMNEKAVEIGCLDTYFITPNGLDAEDEVSFHHTTAADLCRIMAYCTWESSEKEQFLQITQTRNYTGSANGKEYSFVNRNAFLNQMDGVLSGKTGFTNKAGYCYVAAMEINGEKYCIALLACGWPNNRNYKWKDARSLFEYGMESYNIKKVTVQPFEQQIAVAGYVQERKFSSLNQGGILKLDAPKKEYQLLMSAGEKIETEVILYTDTNLPIEEGQTMGICNVYLEELLLDSFPIVARNNVYIWGWRDLLDTIFYQFLTIY
ncbi:MAG: D-alanyl-D-alanine carboxypeptidase [Agathobacter sp.]|nr:D-alanyl-D-alanine carboxypeptidase [Agathobacter sp.]